MVVRCKGFADFTEIFRGPVREDDKKKTFLKKYILGSVPDNLKNVRYGIFGRRKRGTKMGDVSLNRLEWSMRNFGVGEK